MPSSAQPRSFLYVPAHREDRLSRAHERGADAVIADLEDGVPADHKVAAVATLQRWLATLPSAGRATAETWIRIDPDAAPLDPAVLTHPAVTGVVVPEAEDPAELVELGRTLAAAEADRPPTAIVPLIESARGLHAADQLAAVPRVCRLGMGEADLAGELGLEPDALGSQLAPARWTVVTASITAGLARPVASTSTQFRDLDALRGSTRHLRSLGFRARTAIHPAQLETINAVFTPSADELAHARAVVAAVEEVAGGAATGPDGRMVDAAILRSARDVLSRARPS